MLEALSAPEFIQKVYLQLSVSLLSPFCAAVVKTRLDMLWLSFVTLFVEQPINSHTVTSQQKRNCTIRARNELWAERTT